MLLEIDELVKIRDEWRDHDLSVGLCHGCFDILHIGHVRHLAECSKKVDRLLVSVTADKFVGKGPTRPVFGETERASVVAAIRYVYGACISHHETAIQVMEAIKPTVFFKGGDYRSNPKHIGFRKEVDFALAHNISVEFTAPKTHSSSDIIKLIE